MPLTGTELRIYSAPRGPMSAKSKPKFQKQSFLTRPFCPGKINKLKGGHCRDPSLDDTWRAPLPGSTLAAPPPPEEDTGRTPLSGSPREEHTVLASIMPGRQYILSGHIVRIIDCSKQALLSHPRQPATAHVLPPAERKDKSDGRSPPTISDSRLQGDDGPTTTLRAS